MINRPECPYTEDGKHTWVFYHSLGKAVCYDCKLKEDIEEAKSDWSQFLEEYIENNKPFKYD